MAFAPFALQVVAMLLHSFDQSHLVAVAVADQLLFVHSSVCGLVFVGVVRQHLPSNVRHGPFHSQTGLFAVSLFVFVVGVETLSKLTSGPNKYNC